MLCVFVVAGVVLFLPSYNRSFASDDYCTLDYLIRQKGFLVPRFFRPVGDLTLKWTYYLFGENASWYFVINASLHGLNAGLLYLLARQLYNTSEKKNVVPALMASLLFLMYHSVGEVVLWTIGRGISLAVTFSLIAMVVFFSNTRLWLRYVLVCVFYFVALSCYESVLLLPLFLLVAARLKGLSVSYRHWFFFFLLTLLVNLYLRVYLEGQLWSAYKGEVFAKSGLEYTESFIKVLFRIFVPAFNLPVLFAGMSVVVLGAVGLWLYRKKDRQKKIDQLDPWPTALIPVAGLACAALIAMFFGASTRTTEGDRLLYFPAVFYALLIATIIYTEVKGRWRMVAFLLVLGGQSFFLFSTQANWNRADRKSEALTKQVRAIDTRPIYIINLPSDYRGAFMFRNCFSEALVHHGTDSGGVVAVNRLDFIHSLEKEGEIVPEEKDSVLFVWPDTRLQLERGRVVSITWGQDTIEVPRLPLKNFWYWNKERLVGLGLESSH